MCNWLSRPIKSLVFAGSGKRLWGSPSRLTLGPLGLGISSGFLGLGGSF